jgi:hypothetical protein
VLYQFNFLINSVIICQVIIVVTGHHRDTDLEEYVLMDSNLGKANAHPSV